MAPGVSSSTLNFAGPMDSISRQYGIGYDLCGDLQYSLSGTNNYTDAYMLFAPTVNSALVDDLKFDV